MNRNRFITYSAAYASAAAMLPRRALSASESSYAVLDRIVPIETDADRIAQITVCLRPFRAQGPRVEAEHVGDKLVVHNYGHGGSGWSLSWGSAALVLQKVADAGATSGDVAVIGCGALGLTAAITAQRAGMRVVIYAKDRPPYVRSSRATGSWTPDSRVALESDTTAAFANTWERMARTSFAMYQSYLGVAGTPVEWNDRCIFSRFTHDYVVALSEKQDHHGFVDYGDRIADITPGWHDLRTPMGTPLGMIAWLIPQDRVNYGFGLDGLAVLGRRDGTVQPNVQGADTGWNDDNEAPDRAAAVAGVAKVRALFEGAGYAADRSIHH